MNAILSDSNFLGAFFQTIIIIAIGFIFTKRNIFNEHSKLTITAIVWKLAVPCMAFNAFMTDFNYKEFMSEITVLILSALFYIVFLILGKFLFGKLGKDKSNICALMFSIGQLTLFSMPILKSIYPNGDNSVMLSVNVMTISFRIMVYIIGFFMISGIKVDKKNIKSSFKSIFINPIMISMLLGIIIWLTQNFMPQVDIANKSYSFLRLDMTLPFLYKTVLAFEKLVGPLAMLLIGITLGEAKLKDAFSDKLCWVVTFMRVLVAPILVLIILKALILLSIISLKQDTVMALVIGFSAPASVTLNIFSVKFKKEEQLSSRICMLSTLPCIISIPLIYELVKIMIK